MHPRYTTQGLTRIYRAFGFSLAGLRAAWRNEAAFRQESLLCLVLAPLGLWLGESGVEKALLLGSLLLVLIVEILNSAIEAAIDRHGTEQHEMSKRSKDMASAGVFLSLLNVALVWGLVLLV